MPKKKRSLKERMRKRQIKIQRALEAHRLKIEKVRTEKKAKKLRFKVITWVTCTLLIAVTLLICIAWQYTKPSSPVPQNQNKPQQTSQSQFNVIYIWPDSSVEPTTAPITKVKENYYKFTSNVTLPIIVLKDNIVIDGAGYILKGDGTIGSRGIDISYRKNVTIINLKIERFDYGIYLDSTTYAVISNNEFTNNYCGVWLTLASQNNITLNNISKNNMYGIWLKNSTNNLIYGNTFSFHQNYTIYLGYSSFNVIRANNMSENRLAIFLFSSSNNTIVQNKIVDNFQGINLLYSVKNGIYGNEIRKNNVGISFDNSSNNIVSCNNFIDNAYSVNILNSINSWDDGSKNGNYWSDYEDKYPNAKEIDGSGVWDTPYIIDENNKDEYPRVTPYSQLNSIATENIRLP
jgi:parallel beta-helix repeat protein